MQRTLLDYLGVEDVQFEGSSERSFAPVLLGEKNNREDAMFYDRKRAGVASNTLCVSEAYSGNHWHR